MPAYCPICGAEHAACGLDVRALPPITLEDPMARESKATWTSDRRLYLNAAGQVVEADDPSRVSLLVAQGAALPADVAQRYGLTGNNATLGASPEPDAGAEAQASGARAERKPGPDDPESAFAYLGGEAPDTGVASEEEEPKAKPAPSANKSRKPATEDK